jgi:hypothetical protein
MLADLVRLENADEILQLYAEFLILPCILVLLVAILFVIYVLSRVQSLKYLLRKVMICAQPQANKRFNDLLRL